MLISHVSRKVLGRGAGGGVGVGEPILTSSVAQFFVFVYYLTLMFHRHMLICKRTSIYGGERYGKVHFP